MNSLYSKYCLWNSSKLSKLRFKDFSSDWDLLIKSILFQLSELERITFKSSILLVIEL